MARMFSVEQGKLVDAVSEDLKKAPEIKPPSWAGFAKTGAHKERPPVNNDWWYVRAAAILRSVYKLGPVGVQKLRRKYGGKRNKGVASEHFYKGSGSIARKILQQLEKAGLIAQATKGVHKGRITTGKGQSLLDKAALKLGGKPEKKNVKEKKQEIKATAATAMKKEGDKEIEAATKKPEKQKISIKRKK
jgi:small subunit ribosomal protein S19e